MKATFSFEDREFTITTEHDASRYGKPVLLVDGELTDVPVLYDDDGTDVMIRDDDDDNTQAD